MRADVCKRMRVGVETVRAWPLWEVPRWLVGFIVAVVRGLRRRGRPGGPECGRGQRPRPDHLRWAAAVPRDHRRAHQARRRGCRGQQGRLRGLGTPHRHPAPAVLRAGSRPSSGWRSPSTGSGGSGCTAGCSPPPPIGLSYGAASAAFHALPPAVTGLDRAGPGAGGSRVRLAAGRRRGRRGPVGGQPATGPAGDQEGRSQPCASGTCCSNATGSITTSPSCPWRSWSPWRSAISLLTIVFALPFVTLLQRSVRHVQLAERLPGRFQDQACSTRVPGSAKPLRRWPGRSVPVPRWRSS